MTNRTPQPIFLLADSQLLFWQLGSVLWLEQMRCRLRPATPTRPHTAAYIGASNGDQPIFFELFVGAMSSMQIRDCRHIPAQPSAADRAYLAHADLILLSGGDAWRGWEVLQANELSASLGVCYRRGALLIGISAGAMHLGQLTWPEQGSPGARSMATLGLVPYIVSAHAEPEWPDLRAFLGRGGQRQGLGVRTGGGAIFYPDGTLEAVRQPLDLFTTTGDDLQQHVIMPPT